MNFPNLCFVEKDLKGIFVEVIDNYFLPFHTICVKIIIITLFCLDFVILQKWKVLIRIRFNILIKLFRSRELNLMALNTIHGTQNN